MKANLACLLKGHEPALGRATGPSICMYCRGRIVYTVKLGHPDRPIFDADNYEWILYD